VVVELGGIVNLAGRRDNQKEEGLQGPEIEKKNVPTVFTQEQDAVQPYFVRGAKEGRGGGKKRTI